MSDAVQTNPPAGETERLRQRIAELERQVECLHHPANCDSDHLRAVLENSTDAVWSIDLQQRLVYFNTTFRDTFVEVMGHDPELGNGPAQLMPPERALEWQSFYARALAGEAFSIERRYPLADGVHVYDARFQPVLADGKVTGAAVISRDVTEYKQTQEQLRTKTDLLQSILDGMSDGVVGVNKAGRFNAFNPAAEQIVGFGAQEVPPEEWTKAYGLYLPDKVTPFPTEQLPLTLALAGESVDDARIWVQNDRIPRGVWLSLNARPILDKSGAVSGGVAVFRDITEKVAAREALLARQQFFKQLILAHERDRQLMAYEIHDGLVQEITGATMYLQAIRPQQFAATRDAKSFETALKLLRDALDEGRRLISGLRPPILDEMGIVPAIEYLVNEHVTQGVSAIRFNHDVHFDRLEPLLEGTIFRIVQEALTNIKHHAKAPTSSVELSQFAGKIQIRIRDTGIGFDKDKVDPRRFGLKGIKERARLLGGAAKIHSTAERGTTIFVELPLTHAIDPADTRSDA